MNGFGRLIGNENKKVVKQTGLCVILIIIAVLTALSPVLGFVIKISTSRDYTEYLYKRSRGKRRQTQCRLLRHLQIDR